MLNNQNKNIQHIQTNDTDKRQQSITTDIDSH